MRRLLGALCILLVAGCGFQLRGAADLPFESIHVPGRGGIALGPAFEQICNQLVDAFARRAHQVYRRG